MSHLTDVWGQLVRRRLWPVALLLVAMIVAIPLLLAKDPEPTVPAAAPAPAAGAGSELAEDPIVTAAKVSGRERGRVVIGEQRDIFASTAKTPPPAKKKAGKAEKSQDGSGGDKGADAPASGGSGGSAPAQSGGGGADPVVIDVDPTPPAAKPKPKTYPLYSLKVRFSGGEGDGGKGILPRRTALPSDEQPLIIYLGLLGDHKTAEFMVDSSIQAIGDGDCHPTPDNCETVRMREGDTMFFDVLDATGNPAGTQFELDLLDINKGRTADAAKAARSSRVAKLGRTASVKRAAGGLGGASLPPLG